MGLFSRKKRGDDGDLSSSTAAANDTDVKPTEENNKSYGTVDHDAASESSVEVQAGVQKVEAISLAWSRKALYIAYAGYRLFLSLCHQRDFFANLKIVSS